MTIKVGDRLPDGKLTESTEFDSATQCAMAPKEVAVAEAAKGKKIAIFGLPGAYTPTCSAKHVPSFLQNLDQLKGKGVHEVWCVAANDGFVSVGVDRRKTVAVQLRDARASRLERAALIASVVAVRTNATHGSPSFNDDPGDMLVGGQVLPLGVAERPGLRTE